MIGAYHKLSVKHLPGYLDEAAFRWNNRSNPYLFRDTILRLVQRRRSSWVARMVRLLSGELIER